MNLPSSSKNVNSSSRVFVDIRLYRKQGHHPFQVVPSKAHHRTTSIVHLVLTLVHPTSLLTSRILKVHPMAFTALGRPGPAPHATLDAHRRPQAWSSPKASCMPYTSATLSPPARSPLEPSFMISSRIPSLGSKYSATSIQDCTLILRYRPLSSVFRCRKQP